MSTARILALWVPDWPVVATMTAGGIPAQQPTAVLDGQRVMALSAPARSAGVRTGMRRRQARELCPDLELAGVDDDRDARTFEPVALAAEGVLAGVEISRPGILLAPAAGASRFHGSELALAERLAAAVAERTGHECQVGVADGVLAAVLAARTSALLDPGTSAGFLHGRALRDVVHVAMSRERAAEVHRLVDLWDRLGVRTMADLAALPAADVAARFGEVGHWVHALVTGTDLRPSARARIAPDVEVAAPLDPPADRVDVAAFAARRLAEELHGELSGRGASCGRLRIAVRTGGGTELTRTWRTDDGAIGGLTVARITDRVRWQLEGWLSARAALGGTPETGEDGAGAADDGALVHLSLTAEDLVLAGDHQGRLWGADSGSRLRAQRALERVQGLLGAHAVLAAQVQGGRGVRDQVRLTPWGEVPPPVRSTQAPWPGRLPDPAPACVLTEPQAVCLLDGQGRPVTVSRRLAMSGAPATVRHEGDHEVAGWAGPWPVAQRWWREDGERAVYLQVLAGGRALLLSSVGGQWFVEADYD
ncbi:MAG: DNA polymerase Y family protein [Cellulomonadaceae bacterium]